MIWFWFSMSCLYMSEVNADESNGVMFVCWKHRPEVWSAFNIKIHFRHDQSFQIQLVSLRGEGETSSGELFLLRYRHNYIILLTPKCNTVFQIWWEQWVKITCLPVCFFLHHVIITWKVKPLFLYLFWVYYLQHCGYYKASIKMSRL